MEGVVSRSRGGIGAVVAGALLLIAATVGFVLVPEHHPGSFQTCPNGAPGCVSLVTVHTGLSRPAYDALLVATWALLICGVLTVVVGLIRYARPEVQR
jgi:hypothetical protein